jgi:integrase
MAKMEVSFYDYEKNGSKYIRARAKVTLLDGSTKIIEGYGKSRSEARKAFENNIIKKNELIQYGMKQDTGDISLEEAVKNLIEERRQEYDRERGREARRDTSIRRDEDVLKSLLKPYPIAKKKVKEIYVSDLERYRKEIGNARYDKRKTKKKHEPELVPYSASTLNRVIRLVTQALDDYYLHREEKTPTAVLKPFKQIVKEKTEEDFLVGIEVKTALEYFRYVRDMQKYPLDSTYADLFITALLIGARPGELAGLKKRDWNLEMGEISIQRTGSYEDGRLKTMGSKRKIIVPKEVYSIFNRRCTGINPDDLIFSGLSKNILSPSNCNKKLKRWLKEAEIKKNLHQHSLRGSAGTYLLDHGVPIEAVSKMLGHEQISTTQTYYSAYTESRRRKDAEKICGVFDLLSV